MALAFTKTTNAWPSPQSNDHDSPTGIRVVSCLHPSESASSCTLDRHDYKTKRRLFLPVFKVSFGLSICRVIQDQTKLSGVPVLYNEKAKLLALFCDALGEPATCTQMQNVELC